ncbi:hypothetical protein [Anaerobium acetethylicum]
MRTEWPDFPDEEAGTFGYGGDHRKLCLELTEKKIKGNKLMGISRN